MNPIRGAAAVESAVAASPHRVGDLRYRLLRGSVALEPLQILQFRDITVGEWQVRLHILGASHAVRLTRGADVVTEVFACGAYRIADSPPMLELRPPASGAVEGRFPDNAPRGCVQICRFDLWATGDGLIGSIDVEGQMTATFPRPASSGGVGLPPRTRIGWRVNGVRLDIETVHSYPEENAGVRSLTTLFLGEQQR